MFHLCNILQLVIYRFYYCSFPKQQLVRHAHQGTFHVVFKFGDKLYAIHEQALEKVLADIPFVSDQLSPTLVNAKSIPLNGMIFSPPQSVCLRIGRKRSISFMSILFLQNKHNRSDRLSLQQ